MSAPKDPSRNETPDENLMADGHAFVVRLRLEDAKNGNVTRPDLGEAPPSQRVLLRVEHVNRKEVTRHHSIDGALGWIRDRMSTLLGRPPPP